MRKLNEGSVPWEVGVMITTFVLVQQVLNNIAQALAFLFFLIKHAVYKMAVILIYLKADKAAFCSKFFFRMFKFFQKFKR